MLFACGTIERLVSYAALDCGITGGSNDSRKAGALG